MKMDASTQTDARDEDRLNFWLSQSVEANTKLTECVNSVTSAAQKMRDYISASDLHTAVCHDRLKLIKTAHDDDMALENMKVGNSELRRRLGLIREKNELEQLLREEEARQASAMRELEKKYAPPPLTVPFAAPSTAPSTTPSTAPPPAPPPAPKPIQQTQQTATSVTASKNSNSEEMPLSSGMFASELKNAFASKFQNFHGDDGDDTDAR